MSDATLVRRPSPRFLALIVASALFMEQLDSTVLATALPAMSRTFHVQPVQMSVALTSYLLSLAVFIPASGKTADRLGSRTVFRAAIALFTIGSILCAQAHSVTFLVLSRVLQGLGGAMMVPVGRLVLVRTVPKNELVAAMAWLLIPALVGPVVGPPLGGLIVTYASWQWIFYINVPIGVLGIVLVTLFVEDVRESRPGPFDAGGLALSGISLVSLVLALEMGSRGELPLAATLALVAAGFGCGLLYVRHAGRHPRPVLDLSLLRIPTFNVSVVSATVFRTGIGAMPFLLPLMLQLGFGMTAARSGAITFASAAGAMLMKSVAPRILRRFGFRRVMLVNGLVSCALFAACAGFRPSWPVAGIYAVLLVGGFFRSLQFTAYGTIAYADIPPERMSAATSFVSTFQQLSASIGIALAATTLHLSTILLHHSHAELSDFSNGFLVVGAVSLLSLPACWRLAPHAGEELVGRGPPAPARIAEPAPVAKAVLQARTAKG